MFQSGMTMGERKLFVLAGEVSGDLHASEVVKVLYERVTDLRIFGTGGKKLRSLGVDLLYDVDDLSVMGFMEVARHAFFLRKVIRDLKKAVEREKPQAALLVDYPGMNLLMAGFFHRLGIPVIYYISPKVWAWKEGRIKKIRKYVDHLMVIFDFEVDYFRKHGVAAEFAGNPVVEETGNLALPSKERFIADRGIGGGRQVVGLLPGSRKQEISLIFPEMLGAAELLGRTQDCVFLLGKVPHISQRLYDMHIDSSTVEIVDCSAYEVMKYSDLLLVTSGTATLEALCFGTPMIVVYKADWLYYLIGRMIVPLTSISLPNLLAKGLYADQKLVPELLQHEADAAAMYREASYLLEHETAALKMKRELVEVKERLGSLRPSRTVADVLCRYLQ